MRSNNLLAVFAACALVLGGCSSKESGDVQSEKQRTALNEAQKDLADIQTGRLASRLISSVISCTGEIEVPPQGMASVAAPLGGYIGETSIVPGTYVKRGQLLAKLSNPEYIVLQQSYLETAGELKFAEQNYLRQKLLEEQNATAVKKMQESESAFMVTKARLDGLKAQLHMVGINLPDLKEGNIQSVVMLRAPISGYVTEVNHHPGEFVEPREAIFEIVNLSELHLHLNVFEQDIAQVNKDQMIRFRPTGGNSDQYLGKVSLVSPKRNIEARSFDVHGHIETGEDKLKPGMYVEAHILISEDSLPSLPESALVYRENTPYVIVDENGDYKVEPVEAGIKMDGWVEIRNHRDLKEKEIVIRGASRLFAALKRRE